MREPRAEVIMFRGGPGGPPVFDSEPVSLRETAAVTADALKLAWSADRVRLTAALALDLLRASADIAQIVASGAAVEAVVDGAKARSQVRRLATLAGFAVVSVVTENVSSVLKSHVGLVTTRLAEGRILDVVASLELADVEDPAFQDRLQKALMGAQRHGWLLRSALNVPPALGGLSTSIATMGATDAVLFPRVVAGAAPRWLLTRRSQDPMRALGMRSREGRESAMLRHILTGNQAAHEVRAFDAAPYLRDRHDRLAQDAADAQAQIERKNSRRTMAAGLASRAAAAPSAARLVTRVARRQTSLSGAVAGGMASNRLAQSSQRLVDIAGGLRRTAAVVADYANFRQEAQAAPAPAGLAPKGQFERIVIEDLDFTYRGSDRPVLQGVNLEIRRGEVVALVGENGSGKTTLAKLTCCLYPPTGGRIRWDDVDVTRCDPAQVRAHIAVVFQDFARYASLTAAENIGIGLPEKMHDRAAIVDAAKRAGAHDIITALPEGYETKLSRHFGGVEISTGQWQRVALARAFLRDAPLVVLDEPTAALDPRAERDLFETVASLYRSRSALLISHRLSSVRFADRICVLSDGRITESGPHEELVAAGGTYAELFEMQARAYR